MNAAYTLATLFGSWQVAEGQSIASVRESTAGDDGLHRHVAEAMRLVQALESQLYGLDAAGETVDAFLERIPTWYDVILMTEESWRESQSRGLRTSSDIIRELRMLGAYLDHAGLGAVDRSAEHMRLMELLREVGEMVDTENAIRPVAKAFLHSLIHRIYMVINLGNDYTDEALRHATLELAGAMHTTADSGVVPEAQVPAWRKAAKAVAITVLTPPLIAIGGAGSMYVHRALDPSTPSQPATTTVVDQGSNEGP